MDYDVEESVLHLRDFSALPVKLYLKIPFKIRVIKQNVNSSFNEFLMEDSESKIKNMF